MNNDHIIEETIKGCELALNQNFQPNVRDQIRNYVLGQIKKHNESFRQTAIPLPNSPAEKEETRIKNWDMESSKPAKAVGPFANQENLKR